MVQREAPTQPPKPEGLVLWAIRKIFKRSATCAKFGRPIEVSMDVLVKFKDRVATANRVQKMQLIFNGITAITTLATGILTLLGIEKEPAGIVATICGASTIIVWIIQLGSLEDGIKPANQI